MATPPLTECTPCSTTFANLRWVERQLIYATTHDPALSWKPRTAQEAPSKKLLSSTRGYSSNGTTGPVCQKQQHAKNTSAWHRPNRGRCLSELAALSLRMHRRVLLTSRKVLRPCSTIALQATEGCTQRPEA